MGLMVKNNVKFIILSIFSIELKKVYQLLNLLKSYLQYITRQKNCQLSLINIYLYLLKLFFLMHWSYPIIPNHCLFLSNNRVSFLFSSLVLSLFIMFTVLIIPQSVYSLYFGDTINLTENNKSSFSLSFPQLAATEGGNVYVVWIDKNTLYFKASQDHGSVFNTPIILSNNVSVTSSPPQLAATEGGNVYVVWIDKNTLYFKASQDHGSVFNTPIILSNNVSVTSSPPQLAATEGGNVYVVWINKKNSTFEEEGTDIAFKWSKDAGNTFSKTKKLSRGLNGTSSLSPQLAATEGGNVYVVWIDKKNSTFGEGDTDLVFKWSKDAGNNFSKTKKLSRGLSVSSLSPQLAATEDGDVDVVWIDKKNSASGEEGIDIAFKWSKDAGNTFSQTKKLSRGLSVSSPLSPQLAATEDGDVYVLWSNNQTYFKEILSYNAIIGETINISNNTDTVYPQLTATEEGNVYVIWIANNKNMDNEKVLYFKRISNFLFD